MGGGNFGRLREAKAAGVGISSHGTCGLASGGAKENRPDVVRLQMADRPRPRSRTPSVVGTAGDRALGGDTGPVAHRVGGPGMRRFLRTWQADGIAGSAR